MTTPNFSTELGLAHTLELITRDHPSVYRFQNFYFGENYLFRGDVYGFVPFGFSGLSVSKQGDLEPASLVFPNNGISRSFITEALRGGSLDDYDDAEGILDPYIAQGICLHNQHGD